MDTKSLHCKHPKKMKSSKDKHEVFVLPPDILKKLGISIGSMNDSQVIPNDPNVSPNTEIINDVHTQNIAASNSSQKPYDTSILETASLMTKSVFLSPTFVPTVANVIPGEVEILNKNNTDHSFAMTDLVGLQSNDFISADGIEVTNLVPDFNDTQKECHEEDQAKLSLNKITLNGESASASDIPQEYPSLSSDENKIQVVDINMIFHENLSEIESIVDNVLDDKKSLNNNSNVEFTVNSIDRGSTCVFSKNADNPATKSSKINIISEETIPLSKLKELKRFSNINNLKPVTVHTIIDTKINNEHSNSVRKNTIEQNPTVPLKNNEINELLHSDLDVVKCEENINKSNLKSMHSNEYIQTIAVPCKISSPRIEEATNRRISEVKQDLKNINENRTQECESSDKVSKLLNENNKHKRMNDCQLNDCNKVLKDNISANFGTVNGFDTHEDDVAVDVDKSIMIDKYNVQIGGDSEPEIDCIEYHNYGSNEHQCNGDNAEMPSAIQNQTDIEKYTIIKEDLKQNSYLKLKSEQSKNILGNACIVKKNTEDKFSSKTEEDKTEHDELASILNATKNLSSSDINVKVDKVKEIAAYLKKFSHIYTDKKKTKTALCNEINKKETINSNINMIESKLCIQGVEKPGGNKVYREHIGECKVLKTYTRRHPPKESKLSTQILHKIQTSNKVDALDQNLHAVNIPTSSAIQEFCLCNDFGRLAYYDSDNLYEHIHFWHHNTANCDLDLIFAIYSDEAIVKNNESGLEQEEKTEEKVEAHNVCWNIFRDEFSENVDNFATELIGHNYVKHPLEHACSGDSPQVPELNNVAQKGNDGIVSKTHDQVYLKNYSNSDIILETIDQDMVDTAESKKNYAKENIEKRLNTKCNDNISSEVITTANSEHIKTDLRNLQPKIMPTSVSKPSEISNVLDKAPIGDIAKEKTYQNKNFDSNTNKIPGTEIKLDSPKTTEKKATKRCFSEKTTPASLKNNDEPSRKKNIKCGICNNLFSAVNWEDHVANKHDLIAWRAGGYINLDDPILLNKLRERFKTQGVLKCSICNMETKKKFCRFMEHIKHCIHKKRSNTDKKPDKPTRKSRIALDENVTCGLCKKTMLSSNWLEHIGRNHDYLAWTDGQDALNLDNESEVWQHLQNIIRLNGSLTCYKCGLNRSRVKLYLAHIKNCDGSGVCLDESSTSIEFNSSSIPEDTVEEAADNPTVRCGVCMEDVINSEWIEHIAKEHNYLAWHDGDTPLDLDEEEELWNHLQQIIRQHGGLTCHKCGLVRKRVKIYLTHIETCDGTGIQGDISYSNTSLNTTTKSTDEWFEVPIVTEDRKIVKCGVCSEEVLITEWMQHIGKEHNYLAWQDGSPPLNLESESAVKVHLLETSKQSGGLKCYKCEKIMKYSKPYLQHLRECTGPIELSDVSKEDNSDASWMNTLSKKKIKNESVTCGVCATEIESAQWIPHIETRHQYLAWFKGQTPLDVEDPAMVQKHLNDITKMIGGLVCYKCGIKRKYAKSYLVHVETCKAKQNSSELSYALMNKDFVECAICAEKMEPKKWKNHAMEEHYNIAWVVGETPIELNNPYTVESYLKEYHHANHRLVCKVCGISRVSYVGFYAHIIICGKTDKETEVYKSVCDICQNKYLRIYKSQHMTMHREQEYAMERRLLVAKEKEMKKEEPVDVVHTGRRKAAEKAKTVIEKYKNSFRDGSYNCSKCGFNSDIEKELSDHVCVENKWGDATDSDESVKLDNCSDDDSDESDIDSNVSDEEREARDHVPHKKKRHSDSNSAKISRLPYQINDFGTYMKRSTEEFIEMYLSDEDIFPHWHNCELEEVPENEVVNYMPSIEESCKIRFDDNQDWVTFNRFQANRLKDTVVMFLGASIQSISWVPPLTQSEAGPQYLAAATHRHDDAPRLAWDTTPAGPGLIQIWDCGNLIANMPHFALGIAHDYGTVWAIDWCPSGARDVSDFVPEPNQMHRLGLLAAACSNGSAYIFLVPYPSSLTEKENPFYKLKPLVELKLTSTENRKVYQATAIKWSIQKGHSHVVVGYADGTTAFYDLTGVSPLLRTTENNITVFYPYHDERVQNSCIEDVDMYPSGAGVRGAVCAGGAGGAGAGSLQSHVASAGVLYPPHWPAAVLSGDDCLVNQSINELEWWGGGRRLGGSRCAAGCAWCGRVAAAAPPLLRLLRLHPCFPDVHKLVIAKILMIPFGSKRKRQNDELAMIVEPITYSDCVKKYGIEFKQITTRDRTIQQKLSATPREAYPERFPLSDIPAMQFCPTFKHHHNLAVAMHAGLLFIINV